MFLVHPPFTLHVHFDSFPSIEYTANPLGLSELFREPLIQHRKSPVEVKSEYPHFVSHQEDDGYSLDCTLFVLPASVRTQSQYDHLGLILLCFAN